MVRGSTTPFLDIRSIVKSGGELGLLSMAFDPAYATNHRFYVDYTDVNGDTRVVRYLSDGTIGNPQTAKLLLFVKDFASNHNGGQLQFGPDGRLYWGNGDGGGAGDPGGNGQSLARPFAKIMRLNINAGKPRWTLVAYGLRNPWRFSFDRKTGALAIGDVGQNTLEEIDYTQQGHGRGANFGWSAFEGTNRFNADQNAPNAVPPIFEYSHDHGCSITGGYVVRDQSLPALYGRYVYGDFCAGELHALEPAIPHARDDRALGLHVDSLSSFGQDNEGHIYAVSLDGPVYRLVQ
jgi:glucose/arabinose dehydrogenase